MTSLNQLQKKTDIISQEQYSDIVLQTFASSAVSKYDSSNAAVCRNKEFPVSWFYMFRIQSIVLICFSFLVDGRLYPLHYHIMLHIGNILHEWWLSCWLLHYVHMCIHIHDTFPANLGSYSSQSIHYKWVCIKQFSGIKSINSNLNDERDLLLSL